jgi:hypothetical protein
MSKTAKAVADSQLGRCTAESRNEDRSYIIMKVGIIAEINVHLGVNMSVINFGLQSIIFFSLNAV